MTIGRTYKRCLHCREFKNIQNWSSFCDEYLKVLGAYSPSEDKETSALIEDAIDSAWEKNR